MGTRHSGSIEKIKLDRARAFLDCGNPVAALRILAGGYNYIYNVDYYELFGCVLLECGEIDNAGRYLFLSGVRQPEYEAAIKSFLSKNSDPNNFRQLQSQLPEVARVMWKLKQFPPIVASELRKLGWPEDTQAAIIDRKLLLINKKYNVSLSEIAIINDYIRQQPRLIYSLNGAHKTIGRNGFVDIVKLEINLEKFQTGAKKINVVLFVSLLESEQLIDNLIKYINQSSRAYYREYSRGLMDYRISYI